MMAEYPVCDCISWPRVHISILPGPKLRSQHNMLQFNSQTHGYRLRPTRTVELGNRTLPMFALLSFLWVCLTFSQLFPSPLLIASSPPSPLAEIYPPVSVMRAYAPRLAPLPLAQHKDTVHGSRVAITQPALESSGGSRIDVAKRKKSRSRLISYLL